MGNVFVIAEAGVNHNGNINIAKELIDAAAEAGADAVKFQSFKVEEMICQGTEKALYQKEITGSFETQFDMLKKLELSKQIHIELIEYCHKKKIQFLSSPFDTKSLWMLCELGLSIIKIPSGEITNLPYLREIAKTGKDVILSTGMSCLEEIRTAKMILQNNGTKNIAVLHCNTQYPTPMEDVNLNAMLTLKKKLGVPVGYSDHTEGFEVPIAAVALGAKIIEKHFTLDKRMQGPDHKASIEPLELKQMVNSIRNIEKALGKQEKIVSPSEIENQTIVRKSIVAARRIQKGEVFSNANLTTKRPGLGISPMNWDNVIGKVANKDYEIDEMIKL